MVKPDYYGVLEQYQTNSDVVLQVAEQITSLGYAVIDSGYFPDELENISQCFDLVYSNYINKYGSTYLESIDEINGVRLPMAFDRTFLYLSVNSVIIKLVRELIKGLFCLNQQNAIINPPGKRYNQDIFHRDLPYQHFISSRPLAINALFCVDDFTEENGATICVPCSHKREELPSDEFLKKNAVTVTAYAGQFIVLDCMCYHKGGFNNSSFRRRAVNHVYTIPYFKQQINIPATIGWDLNISDNERQILGYKYQVPTGIDEYLESRGK